MAFLVFYRRLFGHITYIKIMIWAGMAAIVTFCIAFVVIDLVACSPWPSEHGGWLDPTLSARCNNVVPSMINGAVYFSIITDFYILLIPLHKVPKMGFTRNKRVGISFIFLTGLL
jgi:hypothetical protein